MSSSTEHRKFSRAEAECEMTYTHPGTGANGTANCLNLSAAGILFTTKQKLTQGCSLEITLIPANPLTPPLNAIIEITRVTLTDDKSYEVAASIEGIKGL